MYIYNVTVNIEDSVHDQWLSWMKDKHIPDMLATGKFTKALMCKVKVEEEMGGTTYATQFTAKDKTTLDQYFKEDAPNLRAEGLRLFADKMLAFRTELEMVYEL